MPFITSSYVSRNFVEEMVASVLLFVIRIFFGGFMKIFLLLSSLLFSLTGAVQAYERAEDGPMTKAQAENLRVNAVTVAITDVNDRIFSTKAIASYEALLSNPYTRGIICDIELTSAHDGTALETKAHFGIYAPARSSQKVIGKIEIKRGKKGNDGLEWIFLKGEFVAARNCKFI